MGVVRQVHITCLGRPTILGYGDDGCMLNNTQQDYHNGTEYRVRFELCHTELVPLLKEMIVEGAVDQGELFEMPPDKQLAIATEIGECAGNINGSLRFPMNVLRSASDLPPSARDVVRANTTRLLALAARLRGKNGVPPEEEPAMCVPLCDAYDQSWPVEDAYDQSWPVEKATTAEKIEECVGHLKRWTPNGPHYVTAELAKLAKKLRGADSQPADPEPEVAEDTT